MRGAEVPAAAAQVQARRTAGALHAALPKPAFTMQSSRLTDPIL